MSFCDKKFLPLIAVLLVFFTSCKKENNICTKDITSSIEQIKETSTCTDVYLGMSLKTDIPYPVVINSQAQYNELVTGECTPQIDFTTFNLVIGYLGSDKQIEELEYRMYRQCEEGTYSIEIEMIRSETILPTVFTYHVLVPKSENIEKVDVYISEKN